MLRGVTPDPIKVLAQSSVAVSHTGDTNETIKATVVIPAGAMGLNGRLRVTTLWSTTNSANNKTVRVRLGGIGGTSFLGAIATTTATFKSQIEIGNRNAANSQVAFASNSFTAGGWGSTTTAVTTGAIDTSAAQDLVFTATLASAGETITLESYLVELIPG